MESPWEKVAYLAVGGLTGVGFAAGSLLLVISHQGRGVVDLAGGQLPGATADGWQAVVRSDCVTVSAPSRQPLLISESEQIRAFGFSPDGTRFIIATSPGLAIYRRGDR